MSFILVNPTTLHFDAATRQATLELSVDPESKLAIHNEAVTFEVQLHTGMMRVEPTDKGTIPSDTSAKVILHFHLLEGAHVTAEKTDGDDSVKEKCLRVLVTANCGRTVQRLRLASNAHETVAQ